MSEPMAVDQPKFFLFTRPCPSGQPEEYYGQQALEQLRPQLPNISLQLVVLTSPMGEVPPPFGKFFRSSRTFPLLLQFLPSGFDKTDLQPEDLRLYGQEIRECRGPDQAGPLHYHVVVTPEYVRTPESILAWIRAGC